MVGWLVVLVLVLVEGGSMAAAVRREHERLGGGTGGQDGEREKNRNWGFELSAVCLDIIAIDWYSHESSFFILEWQFLIFSGRWYGGYGVIIRAPRSDIFATLCDGWTVITKKEKDQLSFPPSLTLT